MITFFRKIRRTLIGPSGYPRYLLYALGEVTLVVIGILIALQINNWNEDKKRRQQEKKILVEILSDLDHSYGEIINDRDGHRARMKVGEELIWKLIRKEPMDSISYWIFISSRDNQFYTKSSGFENLKSIGLDIIRNDSIRMEITYLYQLSFQRLFDRGQRQNAVENITETMRPYSDRYTGFSPDIKWDYQYDEPLDTLTLPGLTTVDLDILYQDKDLILDLHTTLGWRRNKLEYHNRVLREVEELQTLIREELEDWEN